MFELDLQAAELRRNGVKLRLQDQPFQVLLKLIEQPGELVSREELRSALWREDTFVDFDTGLNTAVKRLREALGDSADNPTFIETIPRRGYKFVAPVQAILARNGDHRSPGMLIWPGKLIIQWAVVVVGAALLVSIGIAIWWRPLMPSVRNIVRITNDGRPKNPMNPPVSDGVHLYFTEGGLPGTSGSALAQVSTAGGETTWLTTSLKNIWAVNPVSPDRSQLLVARSVNGGPDCCELWVQPLPAGSPYRVGNVSALSANWTPDGTHIIYSDANTSGPSGTIMVAKKDGTDPRPLAKVVGMVFALRYSPDGRRIRFDVVDPKDLNSKSIWEITAEGKNVHRLFPDWKESRFQCCGNWSPMDVTTTSGQRPKGVRRSGPSRNPIPHLPDLPSA